MGLFDAFTGAPATDAANQNKQLLQQNQTTGTNALTQGQTSATGALDQAAGAYAPLSALGQKYGGATTLALNALGVNGQAGNDAATSAFRASPGYQYSVDQAEQGVLRNAAATGAAAGGNTLAALSDRAGNMADQGYQQWLSNLNGYVSPELSATSGAASGVANADTNKAGVYTGTAQNIANLGTSTTNGITNQNTQAANATMAGNANLWNLGINAAKAVATGGTSLLGGGGGLTAPTGGVVQAGNGNFASAPAPGGGYMPMAY